MQPAARWRAPIARKQRVRFGLELRGCKHHRHHGQQPEHWVVTDFLEQGVHAFIAYPSRSSCAAVNAFTAIAATRAVNQHTANPDENVRCRVTPKTVQGLYRSQCPQAASEQSFANREAAPRAQSAQA